MAEYTIKCKLLAKREDTYTVYVFENLDNFKYIMCTKLPNWQAPHIEIEEEGFLHYQEVSAGEKYFNTERSMIERYKYSNLYFIDFVKKTNIINKEIIL